MLHFHDLKYLRKELLVSADILKHWLTNILSWLTDAVMHLVKDILMHWLLLQS